MRKRAGFVYDVIERGAAPRGYVSTEGVPGRRSEPFIDTWGTMTMPLTDPPKLTPAQILDAGPDLGKGQSPAATVSPKTVGNEGESGTKWEPSFRELIEMLRSGDADLETEAIHLLETRYYGAIRRVIRIIIQSDAELKKLTESNVFWDSVLMTLRDKDKPVNLDHTNPRLLLETIVRHKVFNEKERLSADKRGGKVIKVAIADEGLVPSNDQTPSQIVANDELLALVKAKQAVLSDRERELIALYAEGLGWREIGDRVGMPAGAARMACSRACTKVGKAIESDSLGR